MQLRCAPLSAVLGLVILCMLFLNISIMNSNQRDVDAYQEKLINAKAALEAETRELSAVKAKLVAAEANRGSIDGKSSPKAASATETRDPTKSEFVPSRNPLTLSSDLHKYIQEKIYDSQHPVDCKSAKKYFCNINQACGFGCQFHYVVRCVAAAYHNGHVAVIQEGPWSYSTKGWWEYFEPLSSCDKTEKEGRVWGYAEQAKNSILNVPEDILPHIEKFHDDPRLWYYSQFAYYTFRLTEKWEKYYDEKKTELGWARPIVGIHIRRTDKIGTEAKFHSAEEYMSRAEAYYLLHYTHLKHEHRQVFIASDDEKVADEIKSKYSGYKIIHDGSSSANAGLQTRYTDDSLVGIIQDIKFLAETDFIIGTFSSQVSRLAYEIIMARTPNAIPQGVTVMFDDGWYASETVPGNWQKQYSEKFHHLYLPDSEYKRINDQLMAITKKR